MTYHTKIILVFLMPSSWIEGKSLAWYEAIPSTRPDRDIILKQITIILSDLVECSSSKVEDIPTVPLTFAKQPPSSALEFAEDRIYGKIVGICSAGLRGFHVQDCFDQLEYLRRHLQPVSFTQPM